MSIFEKLKDKKGKKWLLLYLIFCINLVLIENIIFLIEPYWADVNLFTVYNFNFYFNLVLLLIIIVLIPIFYGIVLFLINYRKLKNSDNINPHKIHKIIPIIILILFNSLIALLIFFMESYVKIIYQRLEFIMIPIFLIICICLIILLHPIFKYGAYLKENIKDRRINRKTKTIIIFLLLIGGYVFAFAYPLLHTPASVIYDDLPKRPDIITHRGGSQLGPENTIEVAEVALDHDIVGWEVDIAISYDGVPFLMHDSDLKRTTNVEEVFPNKKDDRMDSFEWNDLRKLDAGSWYVDLDPWGLVSSGFLSEKQIKSYEDASIPSFKEVLNFTRENNLILDFDTRAPPEDHPFYDDFIEILFNMTIDLIDDLSKIMIPTSSEVWLDLIEDNNVKEIWTYDDYDNTGDGYTNEQYRDAYNRDFPIMVYTINSIERFSQLWCLGVKWVKTDSPHKFVDLKEPLWYMHYEVYLIIWITVYIASISSAVLMKHNIKKK